MGRINNKERDRLSLVLTRGHSRVRINEMLVKPQPRERINKKTAKGTTSISSNHSQGNSQGNESTGLKGCGFCLVSWINEIPYLLSNQTTVRDEKNQPCSSQATTKGTAKGTNQQENSQGKEYI
jgi:hypothetical protein